MADNDCDGLGAGLKVVLEPGAEFADDIAVASRVASNGSAAVVIFVQNYKVGVFIIEAVCGLDGALRAGIHNPRKRVAAGIEGTQPGHVRGCLRLVVPHHRIPDVVRSQAGDYRVVHLPGRVDISRRDHEVSWTSPADPFTDVLEASCFGIFPHIGSHGEAHSYVTLRNGKGAGVYVPIPAAGNKKNGQDQEE